MREEFCLCECSRHDASASADRPIGEQAAQYQTITACLELPVQGEMLDICQSDTVVDPVAQRFEHPTNDKNNARKIESRVRFPGTINMAEFTTPALKAQDKASKSHGASQAT